MTDPGLTYAIIFATLMGPIFAVLITRWQDSRARRHSRQATTFRTLMATRATPLSADHVGALNTIEVDFYGVKPVENAWTAYVAHLNAHPGNAASDQAKQAWDEGRRDRLAVLLGKMAISIGIAKSEIEIRQGGYNPEGWAFRESRQNAAQEWILDLANSRRALPIKVIQNDGNTSAE